MSTHSCIHVHDEEIFSTMYIRGCFVPLDVLYLFCWWVYHVYHVYNIVSLRCTLMSPLLIMNICMHDQNCIQVKKFFNWSLD